MTDRYRGYSSSGRAATFSNPARSSMPSSIGYTSLYAGDMHVMPASTHQQPSTTPRGYVTTTSTAAVPSTTTRTYAVTQDPRSHRPTTRDVTRSHRSSTLDSASRAPVIVTTTQKDRPNGTTSQSSNARSGSPIRDEYRSSEGQFYTQPASSIRSRGTTHSYADQAGSDEYARPRDRSDSLVRDDPYRGSRQSVIYHTNPRHSSSTVDYGDDGYQYTNAGELVRYDLDHSGPPRSRRRESLDRGYYRPNINYNADQRTLNVDTSPDLNRNYITTNSTSSSSNRQYENRGGPPPSTRGFDKIRGYDAVPSTAPLPLDTSVTKLESPIVATTEVTRRPRPVSLYQEGPPRSSHHDDYYRSREDERKMREFRDQNDSERTYEAERTYEVPYFHDDRVTTRGFGIRTDSDDFEDRRDRRQEPKKRSDEELPRESEYDRDDRRRNKVESKDSRRERRESKKGSDDDEKERTRFRDKVATGLGIAATAVGLVPSIKDDDKREKEPSRRKGSDDERDRERKRERRRSSTNRERPRVSERSRSRPRDYDRDNNETSRRNADPRKSGEAVISSSDSDEAKKTTRRHRSSSAFNPNDASELRHLRDQLATLKTTEKEKDKDKETPVVIETRTRSSSPTREPRNIPEAKSSKDLRASPDSRLSPSPKEEIRGRETQQTPPEEKQGILKQPKVSFPEEPNPIREGVAPHKEDKKAREAPPGAKWTKISRKVVNPEALTIGKERFEVRDDFVIVLRVLSKEEIQAYASATQVLRERRRRDEDDEDRDRGDDEDRRKHHRHRRHRDDDEDWDDKDRDRERRRRHRDDDDYDSRSRDQDHHHHHHRSHRDRDPVLEV
ncbi:hypothetical protein CEP52_000543 [Fusarium oligoseptatum]|uniref:DUF8035 domain-containing protein n=1 Tax=Fusarium oligoseptatum TaxID=2604345 RepID=A0A428UP38_9HYPO|nr:hypothetical protein CEP52_000543 [Fusarium oligoseptatum]